MGETSRPSIPEVLPLVRELYVVRGSGCCQRAVFDLTKVSDADVTMGLVKANLFGHADCEKLGRLLERMTRAQRLKLARAI